MHANEVRPHDLPMDRPSNIRVLGGIALVLFSLNFLIFADRNFGSSERVGCGVDQVDSHRVWTSTPPSSALYVFKPEHAAVQRYWSKSYRGTPVVTPASARPINEELRIRAAQSFESDEALRQKLGLSGQATAYIPILH